MLVRKVVILHKHLYSKLWPGRCLHRTSGLWSQWAQNDLLSDPMKDLEPFLQVPLIKEDEWVFRPNQAELEKAQELFRGHRGCKVQASKGVVNLKYLPEARLPEVNPHTYWLQSRMYTGALSEKSRCTVVGCLALQVAFVGRSNVGKSSLIDALFYNPDSARISVSKKPVSTPCIVCWFGCLADTVGVAQQVTVAWHPILGQCLFRGTHGF